MNTRRYFTAAIIAACIGCTDDPPTSPVSPPIDRLFVFARTTTEDVEFILTRNEGQSTIVLFRQAREGQPRIVLDSIGPVPKEQEPEKVRVMLDSFDVWALNAPNAPGAACKTVNGQRSCAITWNDYSVVMRVESGAEVRVQRYTGLEKSTGVPAARALGDFVLAWASELQADEPMSRSERPARARADGLSSSARRLVGSQLKSTAF